MLHPIHKTVKLVAKALRRQERAFPLRLSEILLPVSSKSNISQGAKAQKETFSAHLQNYSPFIKE